MTCHVYPCFVILNCEMLTHFFLRLLVKFSSHVKLVFFISFHKEVIQLFISITSGPIIVNLFNFTRLDAVYLKATPISAAGVLSSCSIIRLACPRFYLGTLRGGDKIKQ